MLDCTIDPLSTPYCALLEIRNLIGATVDVMIVIAFLSSVFFIIVGGFKYIMSGGDTKAMDSARNTLTYAIVGLIVAVAAYGILRALKTYLGNVPGIQ